MSRLPGRRLAAAVLLALPSLQCGGPPASIDRLTIVNPTGYQLGVEVTGAGRVGWLPVAVVPAHEEVVVEDVADQGAVWVFRFRHWGDPVGGRSVSRAELERQGWRVEVPGEVEARLRALGRPPAA